MLLFDVPYVSYAHQSADIDEALDRLNEAWENLDLNSLPELAEPAGPRIGASAE